MANKQGSNRIGWNQRGPTNRELMQQAREGSERLNPESYYWQNETWNLIHALAEKMGRVEFDAFAGLTFPGDSIDQYTWKQIRDTYAAKLERLHVEELEAESRNWINNPSHVKMRGVDD